MADSGPFLLIVGPLAGAAAVGLLAWLLAWLAALGRRQSAGWNRARLTGGAGTAVAVVLWLLLTLAEQEQWVIYSRELVLNDRARTVFQGMLLLLAVLYALAAIWPGESGFVAPSLVAVSPLAAMVMIRPFTPGALFLALAAVALAMAIPAGGSRGTGAAWRYLIMTLLALPFFLLAGWLANTPAVLPWGAARVLAVAAILVLGGFPFVMWVRPVALEGAVLLRPFLFGAAQLAVMAFLFNWLLARPAWQADPGFQSWLRWSGGITALLGGLLAATSRDGRELPASLLLLDLGLGILTLLLPETRGWETAVSQWTARSVSLLIIGVGGLLWGRRMYPAAPANRSERIGAVLWLYGCLSLLGLPLTLGFGGRWALLSALPGVSEGPGGVLLTGLLVLGLAGGLWGVGRVVWDALALRQGVEARP